MYNQTVLAKTRAYSQVGTISAVEDASPHRLIELLFDTLLTRLKTARHCISNGQVAGKCEAIAKAIAILDGLRTSLDTDVGGDLAMNLESLYEYAQWSLVQANLSNDLQRIVDLEGVVETLRSGWSCIPEELRHGDRAA